MDGVLWPFLIAIMVALYHGSFHHIIVICMWPFPQKNNVGMKWMDMTESERDRPFKIACIKSSNSRSRSAYLSHIWMWYHFIRSRFTQLFRLHKRTHHITTLLRLIQSLARQRIETHPPNIYSMCHCVRKERKGFGIFRFRKYLSLIKINCASSTSPRTSIFRDGFWWFCAERNASWKSVKCVSWNLPLYRKWAFHWY